MLWSCQRHVWLDGNWVATSRVLSWTPSNQNRVPLPPRIELTSRHDIPIEIPKLVFSWACWRLERSRKICYSFFCATAFRRFGRNWRAALRSFLIIFYFYFLFFYFLFFVKHLHHQHVFNRNPQPFLHLSPQKENIADELNRKRELRNDWPPMKAGTRSKVQLPSRGSFKAQVDHQAIETARLEPRHGQMSKRGK